MLPSLCGQDGVLGSASSPFSRCFYSSCYGCSCCAVYSGVDAGAQDAATDTAAVFRHNLKSGIVERTNNLVLPLPAEHPKVNVKEILVVEDESRIAHIVRDYLERAGYRVVIASNGADALAMARSRRPDLIVLDLGLPRMDGLEVTKTLRNQSNAPIIMLTARVDANDKLVGLELGADDYLTKPFSPKELVAPVRAVFRRTNPQPDPSTVIRAGEVELDRLRMQVTVQNRRIEVTPTEFELLATLARQPGRVFTRGQL